MNDKFKLTSNKKNGLYQIQALKDFGSVRKGELGGYIEKEENLSVFGNAWVYGNAQVYGNARVSGNARVYGDARVFDNAWVFDDAWVYGNAWVSDDARVYGNARVYGDAWVYGKLKLEAGLFFGIKWKGETIQEVEIEDGNYLIYKGEAKFGVDEPDDATTQAIELLKKNGYKIVKE